MFQSTAKLVHREPAVLSGFLRRRAPLALICRRALRLSKSHAYFLARIALERRPIWTVSCMLATAIRKHS